MFRFALYVSIFVFGFWDGWFGDVVFVAGGCVIDTLVRVNIYVGSCSLGLVATCFCVRLANVNMHVHMFDQTQTLAHSFNLIVGKAMLGLSKF